MGNDLPQGEYEFNPAHQVYDENLGLISSTGWYNYTEDNKVETKRLIYAIKQNDKGENTRTVLAEIDYPTADLDDCSGFWGGEGVDGEAKLR